MQADGRDGRDPLSRAVDLGVLLAELSSTGVPLDAEAIAAGIVLEAVSSGRLSVKAVDARLGPGVATLVHDTLRIRNCPERIELFDDVASRQGCFANNADGQRVTYPICSDAPMLTSNLFPFASAPYGNGA
jgi:hypothetical protein